MSQHTEEQIAAVRGIVVRPKTNKYEAVVTISANGKKTQKSAYFDLNDAGLRAARLWKLDYLSGLAAANAVAKSAVVAPRVVQEIDLHMRRPTTLVALLRDYLAHAKGLKNHARVVAETLLNEALGPAVAWRGAIRGSALPTRSVALDVRIDDITVKWLTDWVQSYKEGDNRLRPGSIKVKVQCLRTVIDWLHLQYWELADIAAPVNPVERFTKLTKAWAHYGEADELRVVNTTRNRRLELTDELDEELAITEVILGLRKRSCNRPFKSRLLVNGNVQTPEDCLMFFRLLANTGLRLREAYSLRMSDIRLKDETIFVRKSKTTDEDAKVSGQRNVPMTIELAGWLKTYILAKGLRQGTDEIVFPWWTGQSTKAQLRDITSKVSTTFSAIFRDAGCMNLTIHDLRHEAISRFCEMRHTDGTPIYPEKRTIMSFSGHTEEATFERYVKLMTKDITPRKLIEQRLKHAA